MRPDNRATGGGTRKLRLRVPPTPKALPSQKRYHPKSATIPKALPSQKRFFHLFTPLLQKIINHIMSDAYKIRKNRMKQALDAYSKNSYKTAAACAREFDLDPRLFQKRLKTERSRSNRVSSIKLSDHQELALKEYIEFLDNIEISARLSIIRDTANFLLQKAHVDDFDGLISRVRKNWTDRFMKRNPQFFLKKGKSLTAERKNSHNVNDMIKFYSDFNYWMENFDCTSHNTWNMDETGFRVGCGISHLMMTLSQRKVIITDSDNRDYIIFAECQ
jgi:hypothetical protein